MIDRVTRRALDRDAARVGVIGLLVNVALVVLLLLARGDPMWFVDFGATDPAGTHAREVFGSDLVVRGPKGHDGQVFWALARDPLLIHADRVAADLDRPAYRAQRVLYPAVVAPWRLAGERAVLWGLIVTNLVVVLIGGYLTARFATAIGAPVRAGLLFALNPLVLMSVAIDVADALALAALAGLALAVVRGRWGWVAVAASLAVLAKESSFVAIAAVAVLAPALTWSRRVFIAAVPATVGVAWGGYVRWRLHWPASDIKEFTAVPFRGFVDTFRFFYPDRSSPADVAVMLALLPLAVWIVVRWWRHRSLPMTVTLPFALLVPFLGSPVLYLPLNSVRAIGPAITFLGCDLYADRRERAVSPRRATRGAAR